MGEVKTRSIYQRRNQALEKDGHEGYYSYIKDSLAGIINRFYDEQLLIWKRPAYYNAAHSVVTREEAGRLAEKSGGFREYSSGRPRQPVKFDLLKADIEAVVGGYFDAAGMDQGNILSSQEREYTERVRSLKQKTLNEIYASLDDSFIRNYPADKAIRYATDILDRGVKSLAVMKRGYNSQYDYYERQMEISASKRIYYRVDSDLAEEACKTCAGHIGNVYSLYKIDSGYIRIPLHPNCKCRFTPLTDEEAKRYERDISLELYHLVFDIFGLLPVYGMLFDFLNAAFYIYQGQIGTGMLSLASFVPVAGDIFGVGKLVGKYWDEAAKLVTKLFRTYGDDVPEIMETAIKYQDEAAELLAKNADEVVEGAGKTLKPQNLMDELANSGVKYNADDVVTVTKTPDGQLRWLEKGNSEAGLKHIIERHATDFANRGIDDIPGFLNRTLQETPIKTGVTNAGPYADYMIDGKLYRVAYGTNGYVVSFMPIKN